MTDKDNIRETMRRERVKKAMIDCYGCDIDAFVESVEHSLTYRLSGGGMIIMSLMSDAQEQIERGLSEEARQTLNRAKYLVDRYLPTKREG